MVTRLYWLRLDREKAGRSDIWRKGRGKSVLAFYPTGPAFWSQRADDLFVRRELEMYGSLGIR